MWLRRALIVVIATVAATLFSVGLVFSPNGDSPAGELPAEALVSVVDTDGARKTLPLVDGGDSNDPASGDEANADPRTPVVQVGQPTNTWAALDELLGDQQHYTDCVDRTVGTEWDRDVEKFKATEEEGFETRFLLVVNSGNMPEAEIRQRATEEGVENAGDLQILRVNEFINTRGFKDKAGCEEFLDRRPQIRESLGVVTYDEDGKPNGLKDDRGVFTDCHNPWKLAREVGPPINIGESPSPEPSETPEPSGTPSSPPPSTPPPHDECPNKPGNQPPGYSCPKAPASQPAGVEEPGRDNEPDPEPEPRPTQEDPLEPDPGGDPEPEPEPTTPRTTPPPENEGGDNDGCVPNPGETTCP